MSKPNIPDPTAAAQRVRDIARDLAADVTQGYRKSSRGLRLRAAIVGGWVLLAIVALLVAFHTSERDTRATVADTSVGKVISIDNTSDENWTDVTITLEGGWKYFERTIRHGQNTGIAITRFTSDGKAAPDNLSPRWVKIECDQVDAK